MYIYIYIYILCSIINEARGPGAAELQAPGEAGPAARPLHELMIITCSLSLSLSLSLALSIYISIYLSI